jgi:ParB/RepB/Spo0J family partition protein
VEVATIEMAKIEKYWLDNCRGKIMPQDCVNLAMDIRRRAGEPNNNDMGLIQPIAVMRLSEEDKAKYPGKEYALLAGFRRYTAFTINRSKEIPAVIHATMPKYDALLFNLTENIERQDLNLLQEAETVERLQKLKKQTLDQLAAKFHRSRRWVEIRLHAQELPGIIKADVAKGLLLQEDIEKLHKHRGKPDKQLELAKALKDRRLKADRAPISIALEPKKVFSKRVKGPGDIKSMQDHIVEQFGNGDISGVPEDIRWWIKMLGWTVGYLNDVELYGEFKKYADVHGLKYTVPDEVLEAIKETTAV